MGVRDMYAYACVWMSRFCFNAAKKMGVQEFRPEFVKVGVQSY